MAGGAWELTASYHGTGSTNEVNPLIDSYNQDGQKYVDRYSPRYNEANFGDAIYETSSENAGNTSWFGNSSNAVLSTFPIVLRGADNSFGSNGGMFSFGRETGAAISNGSFRVSINIK